jgi:hypothetical protein
VCTFVFLFVRVKGHQELNLRLRCKDRSVTNAPTKCPHAFIAINSDTTFRNHLRMEPKLTIITIRIRCCEIFEIPRSNASSVYYTVMPAACAVASMAAARVCVCVCVCVRACARVCVCVCVCV